MSEPRPWKASSLTRLRLQSVDHFYEASLAPSARYIADLSESTCKGFCGWNVVYPGVPAN